MRTIPEIIDAAGGPLRVALALGVTPEAFRQWRRRGVHARYWRYLIDHGGATADELLAINEAIWADSREQAA